MLFALPVPQSVRVGLLARVGAKAIDFVVVVLVAVILPYPLGPLLGFLYSLLADGLPWKPLRGQSVGKKLLKLRVWSRSRHAPANLRDSALRNAPVALATFFAIIPVWGWIILVLVGLPLMAMEIYLMATAEAGHRLGDQMGDTEVLDLKGEAK